MKYRLERRFHLTIRLVELELYATMMSGAWAGADEKKRKINHFAHVYSPSYLKW